MRHYGVWSDENGWHWPGGIVFFTEHIAIASAQCYVSNKGRLPAYGSDENYYRVRCIEDWHVEKNVNDTLEAMDASH